jgi:hypothetical protein
MTRSREVSKGATRVEYVYTATANQTSFSGSDASSNTLAYTVGQIDVFLNGVRLAAADYTASNGTAVVLGVGADAGDTLNVNAFGTFSVTDTLAVRGDFDYTATAGQTTFTGSDNDSQTLSYAAGRIDVYLNGSHLMDTDDYVATNGTSVVLQAGAQVGDTLQVITHGTVNLISHIPDAAIDMNGLELILDADADTSITADTDDTIDIKIAGADDFQFTANSFNALSGSSMVVDSGATLTLNGTAGVGLVGKQTMWIPAAAMYPNTTNGSSALTQVELSNGPEIKVLDFAAGADDFAQFTVAFPKLWNEGTVTFQAFFTVTGTNTGTTAWGLSGVAFADSGDINTAFGTNVVATAKAHSGTSNDLDVSAVSGAVTIAGSPSVDELVFFQIMRDVSADNQSGAARLLGIKLFFTTDALTDA